MSNSILEAEQTESIRPDISHLGTEDDTPVDNIFSPAAKLRELGVDPDTAV